MKKKTEHSTPIVQSRYVADLFEQLGDVDLLTNFLDDNPLAVLITDVNGKIVYVNKQFLLISGYDLIEVLGNQPSMFKSGDQPPSYYERLWQAIRKGEQFVSRFKNRKKDNSFYWVYSTIRALRLPNGEMAGFISIQEDIANLVAIETKSDANQALIVNLMRNLPKTGIVLCEGSPPEVKMAEGEIINEIFPDKIPDIESLSSYFQTHDFNLKKSLDGACENNSIDRKKLKLRGRTMDISLSSVRFGASSQQFCYVVIRDVSDYQYVIEKIRQSEQHLEAIFQNAGIGIGILSVDGNYTRVNEGWAHMTGYSSSELLKLHGSQLILPEDLNEYRPEIQKLIQGEVMVHRMEMRFLRKDNSILWGDVNMTIIKNIRGDVESVISVISDITESKRNLKELEQSREQYMQLNRSKDRFFSILAHDLKNPFNSILGLSEFAVDFPDDMDKEKAMGFLKNINKTASQAYVLLENLLEWSKVQSGTIRPVKTHVNVHELVSDVFDLLRTMASSKGVVAINLVSIDTFVVCDAHMLNTILRNLITNAIKYSHSGGEISVKVNYLPTEVEIRVRDFGVGLSPEKVEQINRAEALLSEPGTDNEKGTGLGMGLVFDFVAMNNGSLRVFSELGSGSTFSVVLPRATEV